MPSPPPAAPDAWAASPWIAGLGALLAALGLAKALWSASPDLSLVTLGLFLTTLSIYARTPTDDVRRRRLLTAALVILLVAQIAAAFA